MQAPQEYQLIEMASTPSLNKAVTALLKAGWSLHGQTLATFDSDSGFIVFSQALIK